MAQSLAVKYRPKTWDDVVEQQAVKVILSNQLESGDVRNAYLFCGGAGTGKTTCARIFASEINKGKGVPIEMDAASHNSVEDIRAISDQAKTRSLDGEYKIFILDECHSLSNSAWQAMLKLLEEPPMKTIFIFCTTDPQKIPKTILSRVQRYDFQRISQSGIVTRLKQIVQKEGYSFKLQEVRAYIDVLEYIARIADGGMRDAITMLDKCLAFSNEITIENVVATLGLVDYDVMMRMTGFVIQKNEVATIELINEIHSAGKDLKQFVRQFLTFLTDVSAYYLTEDITLTTLPDVKELKDWVFSIIGGHTADLYQLMEMVQKLLIDIKWDPSPKSLIQCCFMVFCNRRDQ